MFREVILDQPLEVTAEEFIFITKNLAGSCFAKKEGDKYLIKLAINKYKTIISNYLNRDVK